MRALGGTHGLGPSFFRRRPPHVTLLLLRPLPPPPFPQILSRDYSQALADSAGALDVRAGGQGGGGGGLILEEPCLVRSPLLRKAALETDEARTRTLAG